MISLYSIQRLTLVMVLVLFCFKVHANENCQVTDESKISQNPALLSLIDAILEIRRESQEKIRQQQRAETSLDLIRSGQIPAGEGDVEALQAQVYEGMTASDIERWRGMSCDTSVHQSEAFTSVRNHCGIEAAKGSCARLNLNPGREGPSNQELDNMRVENAMGFRSNLEKALVRLADVLSAANTRVTQCEAALQNTLLSPSCRSAYDASFSALPARDIALSCTENQVNGAHAESLKNSFISSMNNFAAETCEVMSSHVQNKAVQRIINNRVNALRATIQCLDHLNPESCRAAHNQRNVSSNSND